MSLLERIYHFHEELSRNRYPNASSLASQFEVSLATARRDIAYLRDRLLAPISFDHGNNGFYYTAEGFNLPFEQSPKILFLLGMLSKMADEAGLGSLPEVRTLERRLAKLVSSEYNQLVDAIHCEWVEVETIHPQIFETIIDAVVRTRLLHITYRSIQGKNTERTLEPLRLISYQGRWYLLAFCRLRQEIRLFHMARIALAKITQTIFERHSHDNYTSYLSQAFGIFKGDIIYIATIQFTGRAAELVRHQRWHRDQVIDETGGVVRMQLPVSDSRELIMKVLQYGPLAEVLEPVELRIQVQSEALATTKLYGANTPPPDIP